MPRGEQGVLGPWDPGTLTRQLTWDLDPGTLTCAAFPVFESHHSTLFYTILADLKDSP